MNFVNQQLSLVTIGAQEFNRALSTNNDDSVTTRYGDGNTEVVWGVYTGIALAIFTFLTLMLLFPSNYLVPIDRRTSSVTCATLVYVSHKFLLKNSGPGVDLIEAIDFDVLLLLSAIMIINHVVLNLKETKDFISTLQSLVKQNPRRGFWMVCWTSFFVSPFLTNDGVCLLFVAPILAAFDGIGDDESETAVATAGDDEESGMMMHRDGSSSSTSSSSSSDMKLEKTDAIYFMFGLACSANIGSALTYTGNPQNMIVSGDALAVMSPLKFLGYMVVPSFLSFLVTIGYIEYSWMCHRRQRDLARQNKGILECICCPGMQVVSTHKPMASMQQQTAAMADGGDPISRYGGSRERSNSQSSSSTVGSSTSASRAAKAARRERRKRGGGFSAESNPSSNAGASAISLVVCGSEAPLPDALSPISPRPLRLVRPEDLQGGSKRDKPDAPDVSLTARVGRMLTSPVPYVILVLLAAMIVMIFVDVMAISGLICVSAIIMVLTLTYGNHWKGVSMYADEEVHSDEDGEVVAHKSSSHEQRVKAREEFFEELFESIDYNLLFIFLGLFVVVANLEVTGIPKMLWDKIVGDMPFQTAGSVIGISAFVLVASQTLGNVAVCQLAVPNIEPLDEDDKRYAWAIVSFVATIGGNLLLTGSAANLIVAEKAMRVDPSAVMNFSNHAKVCFGSCVISCVIGMASITAVNYVEITMKAMD